MFLSFQCLSQRRENYRIRIGARKTEVRGTRNRERMGGREPPCSSPHGNQHSQVLSKKIDIALLSIMSRKWLQHHLSCLQDVDEFVWDIKKKGEPELNQFCTGTALGPHQVQCRTLIGSSGAKPTPPPPTKNEFGNLKM